MLAIVSYFWKPSKSGGCVAAVWLELDVLLHLCVVFLAADCTLLSSPGDVLKLFVPLFTIYHKFIGNHSHALDVSLCVCVCVCA